MATKRAQQFMISAEAENVGYETIAQLWDNITHLAGAYIQQPLGTLLRDLSDTQETIFTLLEGRQRPGFTNDLYLLASVVSGMIAKASHDMGRANEAMLHARTMFICADNADHPALKGWARGMQSLVAYWAGRPQQAARYAQHGAEIVAGCRQRLIPLCPRSQAWGIMAL
jgi:hypothetical protein